MKDAEKAFWAGAAAFLSYTVLRIAYGWAASRLAGVRRRRRLRNLEAERKEVL